MSDITTLPPELLLEIFSYLPPEDLLDNIQHVCTTWRLLVQNVSLWDHFVYGLERHSSLEEIISFVEKCPMLKHIHVYIHDDTESIADTLVSSVIKNCSNVHTFCVEFTYDVLTLTQIGALFEVFPNLEFFKITINFHNAVEIVDWISKCSKLKKLIVMCREDCDGWLKPIVHGCKSLEYLDIRCDAFTENEALFIMENMKDRLKYLRLPFPQQSMQKLVEAYSSFTKLDDIRLIHDRESGQVNFLPLANIKTLECIYFNSNTLNINDVETIFDLLFKYPFPLLTKLTLEIYCCDWGRCVLKDICRCYPNLKYLYLDFLHLNRMRDTFEDIKRLGCLEALTYRNSASITDDDVEHIAQCYKLKHLDLQGCVGLTDRAVIHIANCRFLEYLDLNYTSLTGHTLYLLKECLIRLKTFYVFDTKAEPDVLSLIAKKMPLVDVRYTCVTYTCEKD